jgi:hypothetical protein
MSPEKKVSPRVAAQAERWELWKSHLAAWKASGLSQAAYCREQGVNPVQFSWWKRRQSQAVPPRALRRPAFVAARIVASSEPARERRLTLELGGICRLEVAGELDAPFLATLVRLLVGQA